MKHDFDEDLNLRKRAIANWKKIKILLLLLKMCGGKHQISISDANNDNEEKQVYKTKKVSCKEKIAPYILRPDGRFMIFWSILMGEVYLVCLVLDPLIFVFNLKPL